MSYYRKPHISIEPLPSTPNGGRHPETLTLFSPIELEAPFKIQLISSHGLHIFFDDPSQHAQTPILICKGAKITSNVTLYFQPAGPVGPDFVAGWNKLPDEILMEIVAQDLFSIFGRRRYSDRAMLDQVRKTPQIAGIVMEAFYKYNTFELRLRRRGNKASEPEEVRFFFAYPPRRFNNLVQFLRFRLTVQPDAFRFLRKLLEGEYGFENLRELDVEVGYKGSCLGPDAKYSSVDEFVGEVLLDWKPTMKGRGRLVFSYDNDWSSNGAKSLEDRKRLAEEIRKRIVFDPAK
ncbi:hypothetical protein CC80DRAFT_546398 [Byssothecium circinans]|uniref:Uncharacterized protein n=1 Tax=Byssothecium circinans TaxID=147558 RepID=A0A6A5U2H7_9PLEO|nr:hypothetical protein CC80DRAFT_546398 [Byssothecium circinans]